MTLSARLHAILNRRRAYRRLFLGDDGKLTEDAKLVLADLSRFCRLYRPTTIVSRVSGQTDVPASFQAEGRREVALRIKAHLDLDDSDLFNASEGNSHD